MASSSRKTIVTREKPASYLNIHVTGCRMYWYMEKLFAAQNQLSLNNIINTH